MHQRAAQLLVGGNLAGGRLQERRAGQKCLGAVAHHHDIVGEAGHVGPARRRRAVRQRDHRQAGGGEPRQAGEEPAAVDEMLHLVAEQIGAGRLDEMDERQLAGERDGLQAPELVAAPGLGGAGRDAGIVGGDEAAHARHVADAGNAGAAGHGLFRIALSRR